jgi:hypothetical protein
MQNLSKNFLLQKVCTKYYKEQDPDPHLFQGSFPDLIFFRGRIRIKIVWIRNTGRYLSHQTKDRQRVL